jgi:cell division protein FtsN
MGREYSSKRSLGARPSAPSQFLIIAVAFLFGYFTSALFDMNTISHWINAQILAYHEANNTPVKPKVTQSAAAPKRKPKFEFYTLLANEKVPSSDKIPSSVQQIHVNPEVNQTVASSGTVNDRVILQTNTVNGAANSEVIKTMVPSKTITNSTSHATENTQPSSGVGKGIYLVQVASFKARHDAEHMKGALTLKGFNVAVVPINHVTRGIWFRVVVGPYANRNLAQQAQMVLAKNERLHGMITSG